jgi:hypothetical protein
MEQRLFNTPGLGMCVVTRGFDTSTRSYFYAVFCPGKRHILKKVLEQEGASNLQGHYIVPSEN